MSEDTPLTPDITLDVLLARYPQAAQVFIDHRMLCVGCPIGHFHTLEEIALAYQLDLQAFMTELKTAATKHHD